MPEQDAVREKIKTLVNEMFLEDRDLFWKQHIPSLGGIPEDLFKTEEGSQKLLDHLHAMETGGFV